MNCLDLRRILLADPRADSTVLRAHLGACPACRAFAAGLARDERVLQQALAVPVPQHLAERVLLSTRLGGTRWRSWALAASVVMALALGAGMWLQPQAQAPGWSEIVLAHVLSERAALAHQDHVSSAALATAMADYGLQVRGDLGRVRYLDHCEMPGGKGLHVVLESPELGVVTLILPPSGASGAGREEVSRSGFAARMVAVGASAIGIVTDRPELLDLLSRRLRQQLVAHQIG